MLPQSGVSRSRVVSGSSTVIQGARVLTPGGWQEDAEVAIEDGCIRLSGRATNAQRIDARGLWLLPGLIDLHGDAFERVLSPRPGVRFPVEMALLEHDRLLLANGITTFFYSIADSFEPGIRGRESARQLVRWVKNRCLPLSVNNYVHLRHEESQVNGMEELADWLETRQVDLLSFNDHLPNPEDRNHFVRFLKSLRLREAMSEDAAYRLVCEASAHRDQGRAQCDALARTARHLGIPTASHDDDIQRLERSKARGVNLIEFPVNATTAGRAREEGFSILMGAPNVVHGKSHLGWLSVRNAVRAGTVDMLCSDYHYPSLLAAPFILSRERLMPFETAWQLVSSAPAQLTGLGNRKGLIADGYDADLILLTPADEGVGTHQVKSVMVGGRLSVVWTPR